MLDKFYSGMSYSALGCEVVVKESIIYLNKFSLNRNTHKTRLCIDRLPKMLCPDAYRKLTLNLSWEQWLSIGLLGVQSNFIEHSI